MSHSRNDQGKSHEMSDISGIISSVKNGDVDAFSNLVELCYNDVFKVAMTNLQNYDTACDIAQEALIEIFNTINSLKSPEAFYSWVKKITYHRCTNYFRSKVYKHETLLDETEEIDLFENIEEDRTDFIPETSLDTKELIKIIRSFLKELPDKQYDAIIMYYFNNFLLSEIAEFQKVPIDTVKSRLYYARRSLKKMIVAYEKKYNILLYSNSTSLLFPNMQSNSGTESTKETIDSITEDATGTIDLNKNKN